MSVLAPRFGFGIGLGKGYGSRNQGGGVVPTLNALTVTPNSATVGTVYNGSVSGRTAGSTLTLTGAGAAGLSINSAAGAITGTPSAAGAVNVVETLSGAVGSPRTSNGVVTVQPVVIPQISRVPVVQAYDSGGNASLITLLTANARTATVLTSVALTAASEVKTIAWKANGPITGKGALVAFAAASAIPDSIVQSIVVEWSSDATTESNGSWTAAPFVPVKPAGESSTVTMATRGQYALVPPINAANPMIRVRITKDDNATSRTIRVGLYQRPSAGVPDDIVLFSGPSLMSPQNSITHNLNLSTLVPGRDPVCINRARAGAIANDVVTESVQTALSAHPDVGTMILDIGGNDITSGRPYTSDQMNLPNALAAVKSVMAGYPNCVLYLQGVTFRNYLLDGSKPAVEGVLHPEYGSKPYNDAQIYPWMQVENSKVWDDGLGIPRLDLYSSWLDTYETSIGMADGIHGTAAGYTIYREEGAYGYRHRVTQNWDLKGYVERRIASFESAGTITAALKQRLTDVMTQWPAVQNAGQTTARNALAARLNAITVSG